MKIIKFNFLIFAIAIFNYPLKAETTASLYYIKNSKAVENLGYDHSMKANGEVIVIKHLISDGDILFDIGANIGKWTEYALEFHNNLRILAFEPIPRLADILKEKFAKAPVVILNCAAYSSITTLEFDLYEKDTALSGIFHRPSLSNTLNYQPKKITVPTTTVDQVCVENNIDHINFLKIDTEGGEFDVIMGATNMLRKKNIDLIQFEYGPCYLDSKKTLKSIYDIFTKAGYTVFRIYKGGLIYIPAWDKSLENYRCSNYLAIADLKRHPQLQPSHENK